MLLQYVTAIKVLASQHSVVCPPWFETENSQLGLGVPVSQFCYY